MEASIFEPSRLRVGRELLGLSQSQLAIKVGLSPAAISQFESGATRPSPETLDELGATLDMPVDFFVRPLTETHDGFFRALRRTSVTDRRRARAVAHIAHDLANAAATTASFPELDVPKIPVTALDTPIDDIEAIAHEVRTSWGVPRGPIGDVVRLLESHGVVVIRLPLDSVDVDAFSLPFPDHPVVVLGSEKADRARSRFDGAHELGHLVMHGEQIWGMKEIETQAHQFAAAFLMPANEIRDQLPTTVDWPQLFALKQRWQVSLAALLMRARTLGRMNERTYLTAVKTTSARGWRRREPVPLGAPEQPDLLMNFLATADGRKARSYLPGYVVDSIVIANDVA
ncbi:ImmA/IrrE family metallo-endopeptidase [Mycolicibacterium sp. P1-18]|uniref:XRE family transcriptional regulator n=1 Tax=Mycolicibacterium sp. P1-18 TaxID=2024615 RepID=UPI0011F33189|nr:XRE family transcriptional regulator [Mycolicibacterium sp. P1-18]KAA0093637.1 ImmA/IrrE family metallo-endopeptidase [Mycolicibacterium sp. P1-18]